MIQWMGRYRPLVEALVRLCNQVNRGSGHKFHIGDGVHLTGTEWQVLEYLYEHDAGDNPMLRVSQCLGIAQSSYSKIIKLLCKYGLVEKFHMTGNRKNIIVRISPHGRALYDGYSVHMANTSWKLFFERLNALPDADVDAFTEALSLLTNGLPDKSVDVERKLIRVRPKGETG